MPSTALRTDSRPRRIAPGIAVASLLGAALGIPTSTTRAASEPAIALQAVAGALAGCTSVP